MSESAGVIMTPEALAAFERTRAAWPAEMMRPLVAIPRYETNPRLNDQAVPDVMDSLTRFGARQPIVIWKLDGKVARGDGKIVVGDTRWCAADRMGWPEFPVHAMDCTEAEAIAYRLADNKTGERAEWNYPLLKPEFARLIELEFPLEGTGFRPFEWEPIMASEWTPPQVGTLPETDDREEKKQEAEDTRKRIVALDEIGWDRLMKAITRMREQADRPDWSPGECVTRLAIDYLERTDGA
jgi:hypothetical protein